MGERAIEAEEMIVAAAEGRDFLWSDDEGRHLVAVSREILDLLQSRVPPGNYRDGLMAMYAVAGALASLCAGFTPPVEMDLARVMLEMTIKEIEPRKDLIETEVAGHG